MTPFETILLLAVVVLAAQVVILQRHYNEKLSDQAMVLSFLLGFVLEKRADGQQVEQVKYKIFDSLP
jgi:hypothetical protein